MGNERLTRDFFTRPTTLVASELLGTRLVHCVEGVRLAGLIVETEAYVGEEDLGCHARSGRTSRTAIMYGLPGFAYVYFTYGMHWMFNCVTETEGFPAAVLVRSLVLVEGLENIAQNRAGRPFQEWANGPAKLCQALKIDKAHNGMDLCAPGSLLFIEKGAPIDPASVTTSPRVGLYTVPEPWRSIPWNYQISNHLNIVEASNGTTGRKNRPDFWAGK